MMTAQVAAVRPRTTYVADRLQRTPWANRRIIYHLLVLEDFLAGAPCGGRHSMYVQCQLAPKYRLESIIIREELHTGVRLTEAEARRILDLDFARHRAQEEADRAQERADDAERDRASYEEWLRAGGLP